MRSDKALLEDLVQAPCHIGILGCVTDGILEPYGRERTALLGDDIGELHRLIASEILFRQIIHVINAACGIKQPCTNHRVELQHGLFDAPPEHHLVIVLQILSDQRGFSLHDAPTQQITSFLGVDDVRSARDERHIPRFERPVGKGESDRLGYHLVDRGRLEIEAMIPPSAIRSSSSASFPRSVTAW